MRSQKFDIYYSTEWATLGATTLPIQNRGISIAVAVLQMKEMEAVGDYRKRYGKVAAPGEQPGRDFFWMREKARQSARARGEGDPKGASKERRYCARVGLRQFETVCVCLGEAGQ